MISDLNIEQFEDKVIKASDEELLELVRRVHVSERSETFIEKLIQLHNEKRINIISTFSSLNKNSSRKTNFYQKRRVFEDILPKLDADIQQVMDCILHLARETGQFVSNSAFIEYCSIEQSRPSEGLKLIKCKPELYASLITQVLLAGSRIDFKYYFESALNLADSKNAQFKNNAISALGEFENSDHDDWIIQAFSVVEAICHKETDDAILATSIDTVVKLYWQDASLEARATEAINAAVLKGNTLTLNMASRLFGFENVKLPESITDVLIKHFQSIKSAHQDTLEYLDYGIADLLKSKNESKSLKLLENILEINEESLSISKFNSTFQTILENNKNLLSRILIKWLLSGRRPLCKAASDIVNLPHGTDLVLSIDTSGIDINDVNKLYFLARKSIGYFFFMPVSAASLIISIVENSSDKVLHQDLVNLLFDPLLISYPGKVREYLEQQLKATDHKSVKETLQTAIQSLKSYVEDLDAIEKLPEFRPPQRNREIYYRKLQKQMSAVMEQAEKESVFLSILPKSLLLYGRKSIDYIYNKNGEVRRTENPLHHFGSDVEMPSLETLDPIGLDYMLRIFQVERLNKNETDN